MVSTDFGLVVITEFSLKTDDFVILNLKDGTGRPQ